MNIALDDIFSTCHKEEAHVVSCQTSQMETSEIRVFAELKRNYHKFPSKD